MRQTNGSASRYVFCRDIYQDNLAVHDDDARRSLSRVDT